MSEFPIEAQQTAQEHQPSPAEQIGLQDGLFDVVRSNGEREQGWSVESIHQLESPDTTEPITSVTIIKEDGDVVLGKRVPLTELLAMQPVVQESSDEDTVPRWKIIQDRLNADRQETEVPAQPPEQIEDAATEASLNDEPSQEPEQTEPTESEMAAPTEEQVVATTEDEAPQPDKEPDTQEDTAESSTPDHQAEITGLTTEIDRLSAEIAGLEQNFDDTIARTVRAAQEAGMSIDGSIDAYTRLICEGMSAIRNQAGEPADRLMRIYGDLNSSNAFEPARELGPTIHAALEQVGDIRRRLEQLTANAEAQAMSVRRKADTEIQDVASGIRGTDDTAGALEARTRLGSSMWQELGGFAKDRDHLEEVDTNVRALTRKTDRVLETTEATAALKRHYARLMDELQSGNLEANAGFHRHGVDYALETVRIIEARLSDAVDYTGRANKGQLMAEFGYMFRGYSTQLQEALGSIGYNRNVLGSAQPPRHIIDNLKA